MRMTSTLLAVLALSVPASAQVLNETFEYSTTGNFPPTGWTETNINAGPNLGWEDPSVQTVSLNVIGNDAAGHDDYLSGVTNDFRLFSGANDLSSYSTPELNFDESLGYAAFMAHNTAGNGVSTVEISTDAGATWTTEWTEAASSDGLYQINVDLSAYAGQTGVHVGFHYFGTYAHSWVVDNVVLDNGGNPTGPSLAVSAGAPGGSMTFDFAGYTANGSIAVVYGPAGSLTLTGGPCAGLTIGVLPLNFPPTSALILLGADAGGAAQLTQNVPSAGAGLSVQAVDAATCAGSNTIVL